MALADRYRYSDKYQSDSRSALETALQTAPFYRQWKVLDPGPEAPLDLRYAAMPELTKKDMRESFPQGLIPGSRSVEEGLARDEIEYTFTSGTTEDKVINLWNTGWWNASEAASWKLNAHTAVLEYPQKEAKLASSLNVGIHCEEDLPMGHRIIGNKLYLNEKINVICWQPRHMERMAQELETFRPVILEANPSLLVRLAWWALDHNVTLYSPKVIVFTYELPSLIHLAAIRQVFTSPLVSSYGSTETGFVLMQCKCGLFHQNTDYCRIDFQPLAKKHGGPELGRILVTTFQNPWASVIRFDMGDLIRLHPSGTCACGQQEGLIAEAIEGRISNATFTTGGTLVTPLALDLQLSRIPGIRDYYMEQEDPRSFTLQLLLAGEPGETLHQTCSALESLYGKDARFALAPVPALLPGPAGKYRRTQANFAFDQKGLFA